MPGERVCGLARARNARSTIEGPGIPDSRCLGEWLAGAEGIEPSNAGIKIQCLTTWRRPSRRTPYKASRAPPQTRPARAKWPPKMPLRQGLRARLRGRGGIVIRAPPEARGHVFRTGSESSSAW
jgi:hypothetical protein